MKIHSYSSSNCEEKKYEHVLTYPVSEVNSIPCKFPNSPGFLKSLHLLAPPACSQSFPTLIHCVPCCCLVAESCPTLCNPIDCSLPVFSIHGIFQTRIQSGLPFPFSRESSQPRDWTTETRVWSLGWDNPLEESMPIHSSILAWRIPMDIGAWRAIASIGFQESDLAEE